MDLVTLILAALWLGQRKQTSIMDQALMPQSVRNYMLLGEKPEWQDIRRDRRDGESIHAGQIELAKYRRSFATAGRRSPY